jgi:hypothetical protein
VEKKRRQDLERKKRRRKRERKDDSDDESQQAAVSKFDCMQRNIAQAIEKVDTAKNLKESQLRDMLVCTCCEGGRVRMVVIFFGVVRRKQHVKHAGITLTKTTLLLKNLSSVIRVFLGGGKGEISSFLYFCMKPWGGGGAGWEWREGGARG